MTSSNDLTAAREILGSARAEVSRSAGTIRLVGNIADGVSPRSVFGLLAAEEHTIVSSDWRAFHLLAARSGDVATRAWFTQLAVDEQAALDQLQPLGAAVGLDPDLLDDREPLAGCQAYAAFSAWLALNVEPGEAVVAFSANFVGWGSSCAAIAGGMREHYGFEEDVCAFFDSFVTAMPDGPALAAIASALSSGTLNVARALRCTRLLQSYELSFWNTLDDASR